MKKETKRRILGTSVALLALGIVGVGSFSFAKYILETESGEQQGTVAKFGISAEFAEDTLFDLSYGLDNEVSASKAVLAPGTEGSLAYTITDSGREVAVKVTYELSVEYSSEWDGYEPLVVTATAGDDEIEFTEGSAEATYAVGSAIPSGTIGWSWAFESGHDDDDTRMGLTGGTVTVSLALTIEQVAPTK